WYDYVTIKNLTTGETLDTEAVAFVEGSAGPIAAGSSRARQLDFVLPVGTRGTGQIQFTVAADVYSQLFEFNLDGTAESNNSRTVTAGSSLAPASDLQVSNLLLTPASGLQSGDTGSLSWTVNNTGNADATASFYSHIVVRNVTTNQTIVTGDVAYDA